MSLQFVADIHRVATLLTSVLEREKQIGASAGDLFALSALGEPRQYDVAGLQVRLGVAPSTLSSILNRLEKRGLLRRQPGRDRRTSDLVLTPDGHQAAESARTFLESLEDRMVGELSYGQVIAFTEVIEVLEKALRAGSRKGTVRTVGA